MDPLIIGSVVLGFIILIVFINYKLNSLQKSNEFVDIIKLLQQGSKEDRQVLLETLQRNTSSLNTRLDAATQVIASVQKNVGEMNEIGRSMRDLQEFLKSPKIRGNIGEHVLAELLAEILPKNSFHLQYEYSKGSRVDAAIKTQAGIIPIDSKFPMENFRKYAGEESEQERARYKKLFERDVKIHIESISQKYIQTDQGTIDYALMYIPSEAVYYDIVNNPLLFDYSSEKRVLPVSPTTFYAYLRAILMSFEGQKIEKQAREMLRALSAIQKDYSQLESTIALLSKHMQNAQNSLKSVFDQYTSLGEKISSTKRIGDKKD